ncbi:hypothetical protein FA95DRAFT_1488950 [Auriscalpium vulgare]|uniref:Uncharacterized protein n=1 Tax=Auriscalpium vulgare TaxID=40419 RepID=A0ACB8S0J5_9AGAM|nr:hypothetical protein FA95DRAFT_1488950 [Auriscalpium vulgare]
MLGHTPHAVSQRAGSAADRLLKAEQQRRYVRELWIFLGSVLAALACFRLLRLLVSRLHKRMLSVLQGAKGPDNHSLEEAGVVPSTRVSWRRLALASGALFRTVAFRWTIPIGLNAVASVSELSFIVVYFVATFTWLFVDTRNLSAVFYEDRAAHLASSNLALVVALAGKNNIISFITGIGHERLNVLHRAAARTCLILLWIHAGSRAQAGQIFDFTQSFMRWGAVGLSAFTLATLISIRPIRQFAFEFFLVSHIVLIALFLIAGVLHTRAVGFDDYIWPALVLWAVDRVLRSFRFIWNNRLWKGISHDRSTAVVELLPGDTLRLTFRRDFRWTAGQHAYVTLPTISTFPTEAHPFTIATIADSVKGEERVDGKDVVFLIRARNGFTRRLRDYAAENGTSSVPALVDGPYGCPPSLASFSTCVLISGGSGVSYTLPLLLNAVRNANLSQALTTKVVFVWAVRDAGHLDWISKVLVEAIASAPTWFTIEARVYMTGAAPTLPVTVPDAVPTTVPYAGSIQSLEIPVKEDSAEPPLYTALKITHGRPSLRRLLQDEILTSAGPVSVDVAGPSSIARSVRVALMSLAGPMDVLRGGSSVTLHVETFGMVKG